MSPKFSPDASPAVYFQKHTRHAAYSSNSEFEPAGGLGYANARSTNIQPTPGLAVIAGYRGGPIAQETASAAPTLCIEDGLNGCSTDKQ